MELSASRSRRAAGLPPPRRAARPVSDRCGRGGARRPRGATARSERSAARGGRPDREEPSAASATTSVATRPLYQMLETVRAYAALELTAAGERDDALEGLVRYCRAEASLAAEGLVGPAQVDWLDRVRDDLENYRGALTWLIERGRAAEASDIACGLIFFWADPGHAPPKVFGGSEQILNLPSIPPAANRGPSTAAALMRYTQGELERARAALDRALALALESRRYRRGRPGRRICLATSSTPLVTSTAPTTSSRAVSRLPGAGAPVGGRQLADRDGRGSPGDRRPRAGPSASSTRRCRCFGTRRHCSCRWPCIFAPFWRCSAETPMRRSRGA